jgi:mycothiol synthase
MAGSAGIGDILGPVPETTVPDITASAELDAEQRVAVLKLVDAATDADGVRPLSEQSLLAVRGRVGHSPMHMLSYAGPRLVGYAQLADDSGELVVVPDARRRGVGSALLAALPPETRIWSHGDLEPATAFAAARDLVVVRELWVLGRRFADSPPLPEVVLQDGLVARSFRPGRDEEEWLRVNAAAFAHHAEQGRMTLADLEARMAEPWFDPAGLLLVVPADDPDRVAAFHWTKTHSPDKGRAHNRGEARVGRAPKGGEARVGRAPNEREALVGEVYVVGVDPAYQGQGLGRPLTLLGLHHLQDVGVDDVILYVDGDNPAALKVYRGLGFSTRSVDRMYQRRESADSRSTLAQSHDRVEP